MGQTRKQRAGAKRRRSKTAKVARNYSKVEHHHLLLRMEMRRCPTEKDKAEARDLIYKIIRDIKMKLLDTPKVYYVKRPFYNEGLTAISPIQTSHIAFHFWKNPEPVILKSANGRCLLEFDIYTCGSLSGQQIRQILHHLTTYGPTRADVTVLNRKWSLSIDRHMHWNEDKDLLHWTEWVDTIV